VPTEMKGQQNVRLSAKSGVMVAIDPHSRATIFVMTTVKLTVSVKSDAGAAARNQIALKMVCFTAADRKHATSRRQ